MECWPGPGNCQHECHGPWYLLPVAFFNIVLNITILHRSSNHLSIFLNQTACQWRFLEIFSKRYQWQNWRTLLSGYGDLLFTVQTRIPRVFPNISQILSKHWECCQDWPFLSEAATSDASKSVCHHGLISWNGHLLIFFQISCFPSRNYQERNQ